MNFLQIKYLEKAETMLQRKQMILNECDELINILDKCEKQSNERLKLFNGHHDFKSFKYQEKEN